MFTDPTVQTLIVAGGWGNSAVLDTTELLRPGASAWHFAAILPHKMYILRGANIGGSFYLTGGLNSLHSPLNGESFFPVSTSLLNFPLQRFSTTTLPVTPGTRSAPWKTMSVPTATRWQ